jgi:acetylornithine deacetylase
MRSNGVTSESRQIEAKAELWNAVDGRIEELTGAVGELVRIPSLLGDEAPVQRWIAGHLQRSGLETELWELDDSVKALPNAGDSGVPFAGRPNVTGRLSGGSTGRSLILNGHVDVVSPEPVAAWSHDPWGAEIVDNRMYARGAYDMKSGVGINLFLSRLVADLGIGLGGDLVIHSVIEEECTGNGSLAASKRDRADAVIVTEPDFSTVTMAHLGVMWFRVQIAGKSAHAGWAWQGVNAIVKMAPIIQALQDLDFALNTRGHPLYEGIHHPINLNIGVIQGGDWPSTVPGACELRCRVSFFPDMSIEELRATIEDTIAEAVADDEWLAENPPVMVYDGFQTNGASLDPDEPFLAVLEAAHHSVMGTPLQRHVATAVNDMRYYIFEGMPATCYGASGGNGHAADEWLDLDSLAPVAKSLAAFLVDWCGVE